MTQPCQVVAKTSQGRPCVELTRLGADVDLVANSCDEMQRPKSWNGDGVCQAFRDAVAPFLHGHPVASSILRGTSEAVLCTGRRPFGQLDTAALHAPRPAGLTWPSPKAPCSPMVYTQTSKLWYGSPLMAYVYTIRLHGAFGSGFSWMSSTSIPSRWWMLPFTRLSGASSAVSQPGLQSLAWDIGQNPNMAQRVLWEHVVNNNHHHNNSKNDSVIWWKSSRS